MTNKTKISGQPSIWIDKGIAPMKYCRIDRAAKLLGCEVDDILHWGDIRHIQICVKVEDLVSELRLCVQDTSIDPKALYTSIIKNESLVNKVVFDDLELSRFCSNLTDCDINPRQKSFQFGYTGIANGFWGVSHFEIHSMLFSDEKKISGVFRPLQYDEFFRHKGVYPYLLVHGDVRKQILMGRGDLFLSKNMIDKIYKSSITGALMSNMEENLPMQIIGDIDDENENKKITIGGSLSVIGMMLEALKNADPKNKRWIQSALKDEIKERHPEINPRWLDDYFSEANKSIKS